jgi:hypothetical protein
MVRIKSNIGPSGGSFGYHIDVRPLLERPDIDATRIVWEQPLEGTARELLNAAEGSGKQRRDGLGGACHEFQDCQVPYDGNLGALGGIHARLRHSKVYARAYN